MNRAFSLIEVLVAVSVLSVALVFIFRAFWASLSAESFSRDLLTASLLAQEKMLEMEWLGVGAVSSGIEDVDGRRFEWHSEAASTGMEGVSQLLFSVSWEAKPGAVCDVKFLTYVTRG